jgi:hypothetical protein
LKLNRILAVAAVALPAALTSFHAAAVPVVYTSQATFNAVIAPFPKATDTYSTYTTGASLPSSVTRTNGTFSYTASDPLGLFQGATADGFLSNNDRTSTVTLNAFTAGTNAFGANFFGSTIAGLFGAGESIIVSILETNGASFTTTLTNTTRLTFLGYRADSNIASVTFRSANVALLWPSIDNLTVAAIPEPMTLSLVGLALLGAAGASRRKAANS